MQKSSCHLLHSSLMSSMSDWLPINLYSNNLNYNLPLSGQIIWNTIRDKINVYLNVLL